jgi:hypothetical protein
LSQSPDWNVKPSPFSFGAHISKRRASHAIANDNKISHRHHDHLEQTKGGYCTAPN